MKRRYIAAGLALICASLGLLRLSGPQRPIVPVPERQAAIEGLPADGRIPRK